MPATTKVVQQNNMIMTVIVNSNKSILTSGQSRIRPMSLNTTPKVTLNTYVAKSLRGGRAAKVWYSAHINLKPKTVGYTRYYFCNKGCDIRLIIGRIRLWFQHKIWNENKHTYISFINYYTEDQISK